jgi:hypothetical protein
MTSDPKTTEQLQRELLEPEVAEKKRLEAERIKKIQAQMRLETDALAQRYGRQLPA